MTEKILGLVIRPEVERAKSLGMQVVEWASQNGFKVLITEETSEILQLKVGVVTPQEMVKKAEPIVVLGGDGTLIGIAHYIEGPSPIIVGVNFGHLGFLTEITPDELFPVLDKVQQGEVRYAERSMLVAEVERADKVIFRAQAINEALVMKGAEDPLLDLDFFVEGEGVMRLRGDGLIIATSTGSTAYSLAAGGSIAYPTLPVVLVTPLCAHSLTIRPLILRLDAELSVGIPEYKGRVVLSVDGQLSTTLQSGDKVRISRSPHSVRFVRSPTRSYFEILRAKLNWGIANKSE